MYLTRWNLWGYNKEYAEGLVSKYLNQVPASDMKQLFNSHLATIERLGEKDLYQGICNKSEVPTEEIQKNCAKTCRRGNSRNWEKEVKFIMTIGYKIPSRRNPEKKSTFRRGLFYFFPKISLAHSKKLRKFDRKSKAL